MPRSSPSGAREDGMVYIKTYRRAVVGCRSSAIRGDAVGFGTELGRRSEDAVMHPVPL